MIYYTRRKEENRLENDQKQFFNEIGLFRYSLIVPALNNTHGFNSKSEYFKYVASQTHRFNGKDYRFSEGCLRKWYQKYKAKGLNSLSNHNRKDKNDSRKLSNEAISRIIELREQFPHITGVKIYDKLVQENFFSKLDVSRDTVLRYLRKNNLKANQVITVERKMFEMPNVNDCWQSDTSDGPYLKVGKEKYRTKLIMFIDDKSRMIVGFDFFLNDTAINMQSVFKKAIKTYGKPKRLFVDNGGPYDNKQLSMICASLGIELIHAKPYSPESKSKIERSFRTIKDGWMRCTDWNTFETIEDVKKSLSEFIYHEYNNKIHSTTKETPVERWHAEYVNIIFIDEEKVDLAFLHRITRKVRKDRTIKFKDKYYEVPFKYVGQTIEVRYDPLDTNVLFIFENEEKICDIKEVDKLSNAKAKRHNCIDYSKAVNDERDVIEME